MKNWNTDDSLDVIATDVRKVGEEALRMVKTAETHRDAMILRECGAGLIEESFEVAFVLAHDPAEPSPKVASLADFYRQWRAEQPGAINEGAPHTSSE